MILTRGELQGLVKNGLVSRNSGDVQVDIISVILHLDSHFCTYDDDHIEPFVPPLDVPNTTVEAAKFILPPGGRLLACSQEWIRMPLNLMGFLQTKGSLARGFLFAHACDGQVDPGFEGKLTFEIMNMSGFYYKLIPGMDIASLFIQQLASPAAEGYDGRYQKSGSPTPMRSGR